MGNTMFNSMNDVVDTTLVMSSEVTAPETMADCSTGIVAGTKVATPTGWREIEGIVAGDQVLTFDGGMQTVMNVEREVIYHVGGPGLEENWPLIIPKNALGNQKIMSMMPHQAMLVESDTAEEVFGDPFAMIPAASLEGFRGISRKAPETRVEVVTLQFAQDEVVYANVGALFFCPRASDFLAEQTANTAYSVMPVEQADILVGFLEEEDRGSIAIDEAKKVFRVAA